MKLLLDTHILLWAAGSAGSQETPADLATLVDDPANALHFSAASIWEVAIKKGLGRADFQADPHLLRRGLLDNGYVELPITSAHAVAVAQLPPLHKDPFDRILLAQATVEGISLVTVDAKLALYPGPILKARM